MTDPRADEESLVAVHTQPQRMRHGRARWWLATAALAGALFAGPGAAAEDARIEVRTGPTGAETSIRGTTGAAARIRVPVTSFHEMKWKHVVRQRTEIGCAAASLATILTYYFDFPATEDEMVQALYSEALSAPAPNLREDLLYSGFNLLHIRNVARTGGLVAAGFRVDLEDLEEVRIPVITRVTVRGYDHFVVFREARDGRVYVADPAFGNTTYRLPDFERIWSGFMMGFVRRGEAPATEHLLALRGEDERYLTWEEVSRALGRSATAPVPPPYFGTRIGRFPFFPFVRPQIPGTESVFPTFIINELEFGEDITFDTF